MTRPPWFPILACFVCFCLSNRPYGFRFPEGTARGAQGDDLNECQWPPNGPDARLRTYTSQNLVLYETYEKVSYFVFFSLHPVDPLYLYLID